MSALIQAQILSEEALLERVASHLVARTPARRWERSDREALALALSPHGLPRPEADRARSLCRHLFGPDWDKPWELLGEPGTSARLGPEAERLRADLARLVPLRCGIAATPGDAR